MATAVNMSWYDMSSRVMLVNVFAMSLFSTDAVREVKKYSASEPGKDAKLHPNMYDHLHMKLFRAQRNLYISGFSLFLWL